MTEATKFKVGDGAMLRGHGQLCHAGLSASKVLKHALSFVMHLVCYISPAKCSHGTNSV